MPYQYRAIYSPYVHTAFWAGVGTGKTYTGAHFLIRMITEHPDLTGFVGAPSYDILAQATLRETFFWLEEYGFEFVIDKRPPVGWGESHRQFKSYANVLSIRRKDGQGVTSIFTRALSDANALRGLTISWAWNDEIRDVPRGTHDVILSRMRESKFVCELVTSTPNGKDEWWERFVEKGNDASNLYGSLHVPTKATVDAGILTQEYYNTMLRSYSPVLARQELFAEHVNTLEGRAYYAAGDWNKSDTSPWGTTEPTRDRSLLVGLDFNFNPAPMSWSFSQMGDVDGGEEHVHTFSELARTNIGTREMTRLMVGMYPGFHFQIFGDSSGQNRTTSNAGESDYIQLQEELNELGVSYSLDVDPGNPRVRDRVENVNRLCRNALGETLYTYNPAQCPTLDADLEQVQWKPTGKLDPGQKGLLTHMSDATGYALWKVKPFGSGGGSILSVATLASAV